MIRIDKNYRTAGLLLLSAVLVRAAVRKVGVAEYPATPGRPAR